MKNIIMTVLLTAVMLVSGGCAVIGLETLSAADHSFKEYYLGEDEGYIKLGKPMDGVFYVDTRKNDLYGRNTAEAKLPIRKNETVLRTKNDVIRELGKPDKETDDYIFYSNGGIAWRGIAIDAAIVVPISLPLVVPAGDTGIKFWHDQEGNLLQPTAYWQTPTFYGFLTNCGETYLGKVEDFSMYFE